MNERLKQLLTPKLKEWGGDTGDNFSEELEKFAELIVKECAQISISVDETMTGQGHASAQAFMEHFGVG